MISIYELDQHSLEPADGQKFRHIQILNADAAATDDDNDDAGAC